MTDTRANQVGIRAILLATRGHQLAWSGRRIDVLEAERKTLVRGKARQRPLAREDGDDPDCLAEPSQPGDQPTAREGRVVGVGRDEDVSGGSSQRYRGGVPQIHRSISGSSGSSAASGASGASGGGPSS